MSNSVFISYPSESVNDLKLLETFLSKEGLQGIWIDHEQIGVGEFIGERLIEGLQSSACCILLLNKYSSESPWCMAEVGAFWGANKPIIVYPIEPHCRVPDYLSGIRHAKSPDEVLEACKKILSDTPKAHQGDPLLELFNRCGLTSAFRIRVMDHERESRIKELVENECASGKPRFRLLASSGYNYLHRFGKVWQAGLGDAITSGNAEFSVVLQSPFSQFAIARAVANDVHHNQWEERGLVPYLVDLSQRGNMKISATGYPVNCSLFFTSRAVFYDPYLWGRPSNSIPTENNFWVLEFENKHEPDYDCYNLLEKHFDFLVRESIPLQDIMTRYEELKEKFSQRVQELRNGGDHGLAICI